MGTDDDVLQLADQLLEDLRPGAVVVNHGTGLPGNAVRLTELCAKGGVEVLDAPVSGGRPAAQERRLTVAVGGPQSAVRSPQPNAARRCSARCPAMWCTSVTPGRVRRQSCSTTRC
ncbi:NAD(P)-binding domain-containing protein [Streptomyces sp. enrichment culture]|uniref:NAD(P)-binding domain-containing protein n=1 Tax=Streptomyces sp. enrichment culture TaxID=1795815 RepID=UPI003F5607CE